MHREDIELMVGMWLVVIVFCVAMAIIAAIY